MRSAFDLRATFDLRAAFDFRTNFDLRANCDLASPLISILFSRDDRCRMIAFTPLAGSARDLRFERRD